MNAATDAVTGSVVHSDTGTPPLMSDRMVVQLGSVQTPPTDYKVQCYLLEEEAGLSCGELSISGGGDQHHSDYAGNNLIANYSSFRLMWEQSVFQDKLPAEALGLTRLVVDQATDTPGNAGYGVGLVGQAALIREHSNLARLAAQAGQLATAQTHAEHVLNILFGSADARYGDQNSDGKIENPGDGFGVLRYASNVSLNMLSAAESADVTPHIADQAFAASTVVANFAPDDGSGTWSDEVIIRARTILSDTTAADALTHATELLEWAERIRDGFDDNGNGTVEPVADEGGVQAAFTLVQRTADFFPTGVITGTVQITRLEVSPRATRLRLAWTMCPSRRATLAFGAICKVRTAHD